MNKILKTILFCLVSIALSNAQETKKVLFLGNSYTNSNNLPQLISNMAQSTGDVLLFDSNTPGGFLLQYHDTNATSNAKIQQGNWDYVVLQEQSQLPSFPISDVQAMCFPYAASLNSKINQYNPCVETVFFMTWGRENGDAQNCTQNPPVCTYTGMDDLLYQRYMQMTDDNDAIVSPVGKIWRFLRTNYPGLQLYSGDGSHPSLLGSYAAAVCFYTTIYRKNPLNITYNSTLSSQEATTIKNAVYNLVFTNFSQWYITNYDPVSSFDTTLISANTFQFNNQSTNATSYLWDFGDGTTSAEENPNHTYSSSGNYLVTLHSFKCENESVFSEEVTLFLNSSTFEKENIFIYPNPVEEILSVENQLPILKATIKNTLGQTVYNGTNNKTIQLSHLKSGVYFLIIEDFEGIHVKQFVKK